MRLTQDMGGATITSDRLQAMQAGNHILHARDGRLHEVPVEKIRLPLDPLGHPQRLSLLRTGDGTIYACQATIISKSTDGGRNWTHMTRSSRQEDMDVVCDARILAADPEGRLLTVRQDHRTNEPPAVLTSHDEGQNWEPIGQIQVEPQAKRVIAGHCLACLDDGTLLTPVEHLDRPAGASDTLYFYRSTDGGRTFGHRAAGAAWCCCEANIAALESGKLLAVMRFQVNNERAGYDLSKHWVSDVAGFYKHTLLADSLDRGLTWTNVRQLTSIFGQKHGSAVGLADRRVVVVHHHGYPRPVNGARAVVSPDDGQTWEDEVYYLSHKGGYAHSLSLGGHEMLTLVGSSRAPEPNAWLDHVGKTDFFLIRWRLQ